MVLYKPGDVITECYPFAHCVTAAKKDNYCHYCLKKREPSISLKKCSACQLARYCGPPCQAKDWKEVHQSECKVFQAKLLKSSLFVNDDTVRLTIRTAVIIKKNPEKEFELVNTYNGQRSFHSLMNHGLRIPRNLEILALAVAWKFHIISSVIGLELEKLNNIYGRVVINNFEIMDKHACSAGAGLYIAASVFDHSCSPNSFWVNDGLKVQIRAKKSFDTRCEDPTVPYINLLKFPSRTERQSFLRDVYFFDCTCSRCSVEDEEQIVEIMPMELEYMKQFLSGNVHRALEIGLEALKNLPEPDPATTVLRLQLATIADSVNDKLGPLIKEKLEENFLITHGPEHSLYEEVRELFTH